MLGRIIVASLVGFAALVAVQATVLAADAPHVAPMKEFAAKTVKGWTAEPVLVDAIKAQNAKTAGYDQAKIDALDKQWRAETSAAAKPLIDSVMGNALSKWLSGVKEQQGGLVTEIFVMDDKGLNVGQSDVTSDYWQGDEAKYQKTFAVGPDAVFVDDVEKDESTQMFQSQVSMTVVDPASGKPIGAITVGVNVDAL
ncbi:hypothetical protein SAMN06265365_103286 [Tistlia consotensis]|uniref:Methyl-accepting chemotaxis protein n=1 Tax=Tistlia consotensis USBA 355 TaxID=560819 RepID=A0A1Y6C4A0_9PROT|nr:hypothetical protein [Tistlia consotensis]SMF43273.1 hypothetical protein SAMN05428998_11548 [Tistlia consotensis USBA 355]SNR42405.1 hypothetical protein SAMN06265365_103286 [Tistlia consotensis]